MISKKGQVGKIISTFPVMFAIVFLMAGFLVLVGFNVVFNNPESISPAISADGGDFLLKEIEVNNSTRTVFDAILMERDGRLERSYFGDELKKIMQEDSCLVLQIGEEISNAALFSYKKFGGETSVIVTTQDYFEEGFVSKMDISVGEKKFKIMYYYGGCL